MCLLQSLIVYRYDGFLPSTLCCCVVLLTRRTSPHHES